MCKLLGESGAAQPCLQHPYRGHRDRPGWALLAREKPKIAANSPAEIGSLESESGPPLHVYLHVVGEPLQSPQGQYRTTRIL
jgi:hypothetical protein